MTYPNEFDASTLNTYMLGVQILLNLSMAPLLCIEPLLNCPAERSPVAYRPYPTRTQEIHVPRLKLKRTRLLLLRQTWRRTDLHQTQPPRNYDH